MYYTIKTYYEQLCSELAFAKKQLDHAPDGSASFSRERGRLRWTYSIDGKRFPIRYGDPLLTQLVRKKYYKMRVAELTSEISLLQRYALTHSDRRLSNEFAGIDPEVAYMLFGRSEAEADYYKWANEPYESSAGHHEGLRIKAFDGHLVRSKSEAMIYDYLKKAGIAFRYEYDLTFAGKTLCPDFTIIHPKTGGVYIWEHYGMMDDPEYRRVAMQKLLLYSQAGYILGVNLIVTSETKDKPLSPMDLKNIVETYFF